MIQKKKRIIFLFIAIFVFVFEIYNLVPQHLAIMDGKEYQLPQIVTGLKDNYDTNLKLFGVVPFKHVEVDVVPNIKVVPCGQTIGVKINVDGVMVLGFAEIKTVDGTKLCPLKENNVQKGDIIKKINQKNVKTIDELEKKVENSNGEPLDIEILHDGKIRDFNAAPVLAEEDKKYKLGAWVRDSTSGIGTLTYIVPETGEFGALGHAITDIDTNQIIMVGSGNILNSDVVGITKGQRGIPGEIKGVFSNSNKIGSIKENNEYGIFGKTDAENFAGEAIPIAMRSEIKEDKAYILSNIDGKKIEKYEIEVQKVFRNSYDNKGMTIKVTDKNLINKTGGIIQGMSGSPIIQNGKLIGAVTHVLVNDPKRGYGSFIELMLAKAEY